MLDELGKGHRENVRPILPESDEHRPSRSAIVAYSSGTLSHLISISTLVLSSPAEQAVVHVGLTCHQLETPLRVEELNVVGRVHYVVRNAMAKSQHVSRVSRVTSLVMASVIGLNGWTAKA